MPSVAAPIRPPLAPPGGQVIKRVIPLEFWGEYQVRHGLRLVDVWFEDGRLCAHVERMAWDENDDEK
jgi:hypothetical protein